MVWPLVKIGIEEVMTMIGNIIPFNNPQLLLVTILHHVASHAPVLMDEFSTRYQSAVRNVNQVTLASGNIPFKTFSTLYTDMTEEQMKEIDPGVLIRLYPFLLAA